MAFITDTKKGLKKRTGAFFCAILMAISFAGCSESSSSSSETESKNEISSGQSQTEEESSSEETLSEFKTTTDGSAKVKVEGTEFTVGGKQLWINGVNSAWNNWNDFGGAFNLEFWDEHFNKLHDAGCNASRIWINCNGDVGLQLDKDGNVTGATKQHWENIDDLFMLAEKYHIYLMPTLMSFDFFKDEGQKTNSYESWRELIKDDAKVDSFVDNYVVPFAERYGKSDYLWSIDLCNEPDWVVENGECGMIDWKYMQSYFAKATSAIHEHSDTLVTVGMAMIKYNSDEVVGNYISDKALQDILGDNSKYDKSKAYVDFYSTHWYPWMIVNWGTSYEVSPKEFKQDISKPCMIAELPAITDKVENYKIADVYKKAYKNGWQGVMAWKASGGDDGNGTWFDIEPAITEMYKVCPEKIFPLGDK